MAGIFHGGAIAAAASIYGGAPEDWLDLSTGINPNPPPLPAIPERIWNRLPDKGLETAARRAARDWTIVDPALRSDDLSQLPLPVPGTQAFIQQLPSLVPPGRRVAILSPTYGEYAHGFERAGFAVDRIGSIAELTGDHGTLVLVNPNNPTGRTFSREELITLADRMAAQDGHLHVDEAFGDARPELTVAHLADQRAGLSVSRSFGKYFGMAGVRLGFVFATASFLARLDAGLGPWATPGPALFVAEHMMRLDRLAMNAALALRRGALEEVLTWANLTVVGGSELFALIEHDDAPALFEHLARSHILVRRFDYAPRWLRIGLAPDQQGDRRLASALASARD